MQVAQLASIDNNLLGVPPFFDILSFFENTKTIFIIVLAFYILMQSDF
jgi:hypothetical protein